MFLILDYDETYTADPDVWDTFIVAVKNKGHSIICCTYRFADRADNFELELDMKKHDLPIVYAAGFANKWEAIREAGYIPENAIWIDDAPHMITVNMKF